MINTNVKISVIVPVYNVEKWLNMCVDSILAQSYKKLEIILRQINYIIYLEKVYAELLAACQKQIYVSLVSMVNIA